MDTLVKIPDYLNLLLKANILLIAISIISSSIFIYMFFGFKFLVSLLMIFGLITYYLFMKGKK